MAEKTLTAEGQPAQSVADPQECRSPRRSSSRVDSRRDKLGYYAELSKRLHISPPFASAKHLNPDDLQRVCGELRRDARE